MDAAIVARGLRKRYGALEAVRGVDLEVQRGEIFALLGPNGAGKTTTIEILEGYLEPTAGEVRVLGEDPRHADHAWRARIGIVLQSIGLDPYLTVRETLELYAGYYPAPRDVDEVLELVGLADQRHARVRRLSGGQQRRLDVAVALVGDPELLFLDEPTTGFDPQARRSAWEMVRGLAELGKTVFLTTHYMDEAEALASRVAIIVAGRIVAEGPPGSLGDRHLARTRIRFRVADGARRSIPVDVVGLPDGSLEVRTPEPTRVLHELTGWALQQGIELEELQVTRPTLEDAYLELIREEP
jgi:ABC-2 type transport system ATP-binding protein